MGLAFTTITLLFLGTGVLHCDTPAAGVFASGSSAVTSADNGDGTYTNPVLCADYSDPDAIRVGDDYYLVSSSFNCVPGLQVLHSFDLVNWTIAGHILDALPSPDFDVPQHGNGVWAPSIRFHNGEYWVYYGDPDRGIYLCKTKLPEGKWEPPALVKGGKGMIDPCPLWDDDGNAYLVHAWAKSRAGFNSLLTVHRMSQDGSSLLDDGKVVFDGNLTQPTIEGPKFYKRGGFYYIFAPAGGVKTGWQTVLRSRNVFGPYDQRVVLHQGSTRVNGPHQGAWVETQSGESWFLHFQDAGAYGRVVHLQPMVWRNDFPVIGLDTAADGIGQPVLSWRKPDVGKVFAAQTPQASDDFNNASLGEQWQWNANPAAGRYSLSARKGYLRLFPVPVSERVPNLWGVPNLLLQKFPARSFTVTALVVLNPAAAGDIAGLVVMGVDYGVLAIERTGNGLRLVRKSCFGADTLKPETVEAEGQVNSGRAFLRVSVDSAANCTFSVSDDGLMFRPAGEVFKAREGKWIGAKVGLFCTARTPGNGYADIDWFRVE